VPRVCELAWPIVRHRLSSAGLAEIFHEVKAAAAHGGFTADHTHLSRTQLVLDEQGRTALTKELEARMARVERIHEQAHKRLGNDDGLEPSVTLVVLRFNDAPTSTRGKAPQHAPTHDLAPARPPPLPHQLTHVYVSAVRMRNAGDDMANARRPRGALRRTGGWPTSAPRLVPPAWCPGVTAL
jgi:hypothetical protein